MVNLPSGVKPEMYVVCDNLELQNQDLVLKGMARMSKVFKSLF